MDLIKKIWPVSFQVRKGNVGSLVWRVILSVVLAAVLSIVFGLLDNLPLIGWIFSLLYSLVDIYLTAGIVFCFLVFFQVGPFKN